MSNIWSWLISKLAALQANHIAARQQTSDDAERAAARIAEVRAKYAVPDDYQKDD